MHPLSAFESQCEMLSKFTENVTIRRWPSLDGVECHA